MRSHLLRRAYARVLHLSPVQNVPLVGGPADGIVLAVPRPAPPWVFAALRPMVDGRTLLATAADEMAVYVCAEGPVAGVARYRRSGARYVHEGEVPSLRPA